MPMTDHATPDPNSPAGGLTADNASNGAAPGAIQPADAPELLSRRAFARLKGWAPSHVVRLCQDGVLSLWCRCPGCGSTCNLATAACTCGQAIAGVIEPGKAFINAEVANAELERARHPEKAHVAARHAEARGDSAPASGQGTADAEPELPLEDDSNVRSYSAAKARREYFAAQSAELDYMQRVGQLGQLEAMQREAFRVARQVRDLLTMIPDRLAPVLAAERDEARVHHLLLTEITQVCHELSRSLGQPGDAAAAAG